MQAAMQALVEKLPFELTADNGRKALVGVYALAGAPKALGLAGSQFREWGYPGAFAVVAGALELAGAYALYAGGDLLLPGALLLQAVMGGAALTLLRSPMAPAVVSPLGFAYALFRLMESAGVAQAQLTAAAMAVGVFGGLVLKALGPRPAKSAPKKKSR